jgi:hypothetical protein
MAVIRTPIGRVIPGTAARPAAGGGGARVTPGPATRPKGSGAAGDDWSSDDSSSVWTGEQSGGSSGGSSSGYYQYLINQQKLKQQQAATAAAKAGTQAQADYLRGMLGQGVPSSVSSAIEAQRAAGERYILDQERALMDLLGQRYGEATGTTGTAYTTLANYLQQNAPTAYAQAQRAVPQTYQTALGQYMAGQGVSPQAAQAAVEVQNVLGAGGAANYNQLLNVLAAREAATQQSRLAEAELARTGALSRLGAAQAASATQIQQQRLAGLAELSNRIAAQQLAAEQQVAARDQALRDALGKLVGTGYLTPEQIAALAPSDMIPKL